MDKMELERFFEELLADGNGDSEAPSAVARAQLFAALRNSRNTRSAIAALDCEKLAAFLDGKLEAQEAEEFLKSLLAAPDEIYELESAQDFLDAVSANGEAAPADLVAQAVTAAADETPRRATRQGRRWNGAAWGRQWGWAGGAIAAAVLAAVISKRVSENEAVQSPPAHSQLPVAAGRSPSAAL